MKIINLLWTDGRDVHHPTNEPNPTHVESLGQGKTRLNLIKLHQRFGTKIVPPKMPHGMSKCSHPTLSQI